MMFYTVEYLPCCTILGADSYTVTIAETKCPSKAGRLVGLADCYAAIVLADSATFLLAVNRIAAFRLHSAVIP